MPYVCSASHKEVIVRAIDLRNLWVRMAIRNSVMHNLRATEVLAIESDDVMIVAAQRLYLFNDVKSLLTRTLGISKKVCVNVKDVEVMRREMQAMADGTGELGPLRNVIPSNLESLIKWKIDLEGKTKEDAEFLVKDWNFCLVRCERLMNRRTTPAPIVQEKLASTAGGTPMVEPAQTVKLTKKQSKAQLKKGEKLKSITAGDDTDEPSSLTYIANITTTAVNMRGVEKSESQPTESIETPNDNRSPHSTITAEDEGTDGEFEIVGALRKTKPTPAAKYFIQIPKQQPVYVRIKSADDLLRGEEPMNSEVHSVRGVLDDQEPKSQAIVEDKAESGAEAPSIERLVSEGPESCESQKPHERRRKRLNDTGNNFRRNRDYTPPNF